jgi:hypothetical protein
MGGLVLMHIYVNHLQHYGITSLLIEYLFVYPQSRILVLIGILVLLQTPHTSGLNIHTLHLILGIAAQEAIKLITHQFTPLPCAFIYNAINGSSQSFSL